jgi:hypothetical protein
MGQTNGNRHPANANRQRIARQKPAPVQRLHFDPCLKTKTAQTMTLSFTELRPVNLNDPRDPVQRQSV